jgi:hypothetical protein
MVDGVGGIATRAYREQSVRTRPHAFGSVYTRCANPGIASANRCVKPSARIMATSVTPTPGIRTQEIQKQAAAVTKSRPVSRGRGTVAVIFKIRVLPLPEAFYQRDLTHQKINSIMEGLLN